MDVTKVIDAIPGWFGPSDVKLFSWFLRAQAEAGVRGDLAELGTYLGRSAVLMGSFLQPGESLTVVDLFGGEADSIENRHENEKFYAGLSRSAFEDNYRSALGSLPTVITGPTSEIGNHAPPGTFRFVHVDASHLYEHVRQDIQSARTLLLPNGIAVFDDILSPHTPGVQAAVWEAVATGDLRPVVISDSKLYATWGDYATWQGRLKSSMPPGLEYETQQVAGGPLLRVWSSPHNRRRRVAEALVPPALLRRGNRLRRYLLSKRGGGSARQPSSRP